MAAPRRDIHFAARRRVSAVLAQLIDPGPARPKARHRRARRSYFASRFERDPGGDCHERRARAWRKALRRGSGIQRIETHIEAECEMRADEPAGTAAVVDRFQHFVVGEKRSDAIARNDRPGGASDTAAQVAPAVARTEVQRELRPERSKLLGD